ncbi:MAG: peptide deformylase [Chloroflexi bacterium]|nr:peptide deformylase [Chloroflexota bacterium]
MAVRPVLKAPDPKLTQRAKKVTSFDASLQALIEDMVETMHHVNGVGLAAPQIGVPLRLCVIQLPDTEELLVLANPEIVKTKGEREVSEGCLSVPGYRGNIKRALEVTVKGRDRYGKAIRLKATELLAQALEHELDHLNGILYIDHLESPEHLYKIEAQKEPEELA